MSSFLSNHLTQLSKHLQEIEFAAKDLSSAKMYTPELVADVTNRVMRRQREILAIVGYIKAWDEERKK